MTTDPASVTITVSPEIAAALPDVRLLSGWRAGTEILRSQQAFAAVADVAILARRAWDEQQAQPPAG